MTKDISEQAMAYIQARAVPPHVAHHAGFTVTSDAKTIDPGFHSCPALVLPYCDVNGAFTSFGRVRYFDPPIVGGILKRALRYQQPKNTAPELYLPRVEGLDWTQALSDPRWPLAITEGEVKSLSATVNTGTPFIGLGGVFNWADHKQPLPLLEKIKWARRKVYIVFDSDTETNPNVQLAEARLADFLSRSRAVVHRVRIPPTPTGDKQGADDLIAVSGGEALKSIMAQTSALSDLDLRILHLNKDVAYLEEDEMILNLNDNSRISRSAFVKGSVFSALECPALDPTKPKIKVADRWLTSNLARRHKGTIFLPGGSEVVPAEDGKGTYINSWIEPPCRAGDPTPFIELTRYLFSEALHQVGWDFPIKLLAFKAQNQRRKIPLALMLVGTQGSGKSLWARMALSAFGPYGVAKDGKLLSQQWNAFIERALVAAVDDIAVETMRKNIEMLRNWISEPRIERSEKYLTNREVANYCLFIFTTNKKAATAFDHDDRRFIVVGTPSINKPQDEYEALWSWVTSGEAGPVIYDYLLNYDLKGWVPPMKAPNTAEKVMAYEESLSEFEALARTIQTADVHVVVQWLRSAEQWAAEAMTSGDPSESKRAQEIRAAIQTFPVRPWYTAKELVSIFPHLSNSFTRSSRDNVHGALPGQVSSALRDAGVDFLRCLDNDAGFMFNGRAQQFLIVAPSAGYPKSMTQAQFDEHMSKMQNYQPLTVR